MRNLPSQPITTLVWDCPVCGANIDIPVFNNWQGKYEDTSKVDDHRKAHQKGGIDL